jgi:L-threonylcarbamoyladenylate synthase
MIEIILYPTETVYALGVNPLDEKAWRALCALKQRSDEQPASWLVRDIADIRQYAEVGEVTTRIIERCMPGPVTLVLPAKESVPSWSRSASGMVSFRLSPDPYAQELIESYMSKNNAPLTCTSANVHGLPTASDVSGIKKQFGDAATDITQTIDGGVRTEMASTVVSVKNNQLKILRPGPVSIEELAAALG